MATLLRIPKRSSEVVRLALGFKYRLAQGDAVTGIQSLAIADSTGTDKTAEMIQPLSSQVDSGGRSVSAMFVGGQSGQTYLVTARVTTRANETLEGHMLLPVSDG